MTVYNYLKNIFLILIFLHIAPSLIEGIRKQYSHYLEPRTQVGVLKIKGVLYDSSFYTKQLYTFFKNPQIKGILIQMDCLGSAAGTGQTIFNEIKILKQEFPKPVVTLVENVCASGGYLISCASDYIIAPPAAIIGSVGSYFSNIQLREFLEQFKIRYTTVTAGTYKTTTNPFVDTTEQERLLLQGIQNDVYKQFVQHVAKARKLSLVNITEWADGKLFTGQQALQLGLIDEIGSTQNAIRVLKEKALIEGVIEWVKPPAKRGFLSFFGGREQDHDNSMFTNALNQICTFLETRYSGIKL